MLAMQNDDGGWAAFDRTIHRPILEHIPFADHNAIQDPSCPDITGRTLECLGHHGVKTDASVVTKALSFLEVQARGRGLLVWPMGCELYLRHMAGGLWATDGGGGYVPAVDPEGRPMVA